MAGEYLITLGQIEQLDDLIRGPLLHGRAEPRIALVGRSNVGKSTLINSLMGGKLARVSNQPGKTRQIHFYSWKNTGRILADLPGYGYARVGHAERDRWAEFINAYLRADEKLDRALVLLDSRHGPTEIDKEAIRYMSLESVPVVFAFTKVDQLKTQSERARRRKEGAAALLELGYDPSCAYWVSSRDVRSLKALEAALMTSTGPRGLKEDRP